MIPSFWNIVTDTQTGDGELHIDGLIDDMESWWYETTTPRNFRKQLSEIKGNLTVSINSPGGSLYAGADIYTALREFSGRVTVKVSGIAASAASLIAMAGDEVLMSPASYMLIHNVSTGMHGNQYDAASIYAQLQEADEGAVSIYARKTGKNRDELLEMMRANTLMSAQTAVDEGFADGILYDGDTREKQEGTRARVSLAACGNTVLTAMMARHSPSLEAMREGSIALGNAFTEGIRAGLEDTSAHPADSELALRKELEARAKIVLAQMERPT